MKRPLLPILLVAATLTFGACGADGDFSAAESAESTLDITRSTTTTAAEIEQGKDGPVDGVRRLWIKPDLVDCVGAAPQKCMQVAEAEDDEHYYFYDQIQGFTFEPGTSYVLDVQVEEILDPPADASSLKYTLVAVIEAN